MQISGFLEDATVYALVNDDVSQLWRLFTLNVLQLLQQWIDLLLLHIRNLTFTDAITIENDLPATDRNFLRRSAKLSSCGRPISDSSRFRRGMMKLLRRKRH